jgi:hypothetical protein
VLRRNTFSRRLNVTQIYRIELTLVFEPHRIVSQRDRSSVSRHQSPTRHLDAQGSSNLNAAEAAGAANQFATGWRCSPIHRPSCASSTRASIDLRKKFFRADGLPDYTGLILKWLTPHSLPPA